MDSERLRLKELLRANFLQHYAVIRRNTDELVQLASSLQTSLDSNAAPPPAHDLKAKTVRMQKLAHEIRENMAGWKVPKARRMRARAPAMAGANGLDGRQLLRANVSAAQTAASQLQSAVEDYLGNDNEHSVSVRALQTSADKQHFDPHLVAILKDSVQLEQLAREIRSKIHTLYPSH
ncbi:MAG TPA: hypothetical protein VFT65_11660 [Candidatus Angelobacter sp.]|nr:hypothetical protein [Candidatus Angelobacter sp.]